MNTLEIKQQIEDYRKKVESEVVFDKNKHIYQRIEDGYFLTGVTTILGVKSKEFLQFWAAKEAVKSLGWYDLKEGDDEDKQNLFKRYSEIVQMDVDSYWRELDNAKKAHTAKAREGQKKGKIVHEFCEQYIKNKIDPSMFPAPSIPLEDEMVANSIRLFLNWEESNKVEWLASEMMVWSPEHLFAGTIDWLAIVNNIFTLGDIKTNNQLSEDVILQTGGYNLCLREGGINPEQRLVLRIPKSGDGFEAKVISTDLDFDCQSFLSLRNVHRWNLYLEKFKDENGKLCF